MSRTSPQPWPSSGAAHSAAVASRELPWADLHINEMISLIGDVAHALAVRHERAGRRSAARDAALRGLRTESESEVLEAIVARTLV